MIWSTPLTSKEIRPISRQYVVDSLSMSRRINNM